MTIVPVWAAVTVVMLPSPVRVLGPGCSSALLAVVLAVVVVVHVVVVETEERRKVVVGRDGNGEMGGGGDEGVEVCTVGRDGVLGACTTTGEEGDVLVEARGMVVQATREEMEGVYTVRGSGGEGRRMGTCDMVRAGVGDGVTWGLVEAGGRTLDRES